MDVRTYVGTDVHDVMAIKPIFLASMGYHIFLTMVLRVRARKSAINTLLGSLRNEDGDGNEDFILKYEFALFISLRNYFMSFRV